ARTVDVDALGLQLLDRLVDDVVGVRRCVWCLGQDRLAVEVLRLAGDLGCAVPGSLVDDANTDRGWPDQLVDLVHLPQLVGRTELRALGDDDVAARLGVVAAERPALQRGLDEGDRLSTVSG